MSKTADMPCKNGAEENHGLWKKQLFFFEAAIRLQLTGEFLYLEFVEAPCAGLHWKQRLLLPEKQLYTDIMNDMTHKICSK